jgi:hypothetical protein
LRRFFFGLSWHRARLVRRAGTTGVAALTEGRRFTEGRAGTGGPDLVANP